MKILITGSRGFVGSNLKESLKNIRQGYDHRFADLMIDEIYEYDQDSDPGLLSEYCTSCSFVFHLAGVNRPQKPEEYLTGNLAFTETLIDNLRKRGNHCPIVFSSSIQASLDNPYGQSKKAAEELLIDYSRETGAQVMIYRFPNIFGKWCRPNYNSVVATFCHNVARNLPITVHDPEKDINLVYIDDVVTELISTFKYPKESKDFFHEVSPVYCVRLGYIAELIHSFYESRNTVQLPDLGNDFVRKLHATYLSYLPENELSYPLKSTADERGSFTEVFRTENRGQFSINVIKPGITKGNHWHKTKNEKFVVVSGHGIIRMRKVGRDANGYLYPLVEYEVSGDDLKVVEIIPGYAHNITNLSETDNLVTLIWADECFDPKKPDTYYFEV